VVHAIGHAGSMRRRMSRGIIEPTHAVAIGACVKLRPSIAVVKTIPTLAVPPGPLLRDDTHGRSLRGAPAG
jgi:hypothetical protein